MHYVIGDIHGQIGMLKRLLKKLNLQPEDEVYFVGDWFDRFFTRRDQLEMCEWMVQNLTPGSRFKSVVGNHDIGMLEHIHSYARIVRDINAYSVVEELDSLNQEQTIEENIRKLYPAIGELINSMPLFYEFETGGKKYIITHSWLLDWDGAPIGSKEFRKEFISQRYSIWDRKWSVTDWEYTGDMPCIIHGHTPTLGDGDKFMDGVNALARIRHVSSKNINIDCCAFFSPMRGGNLAAYCCEDGREIYAYEEEDFYRLVDSYTEAYQGAERRITKEEYIYAVLFFNKYADSLCREDTYLLKFSHPEAEKAYWHMKNTYTGYSLMEISMDINRRMRTVKGILQETVPEFWVKHRDIL